MKIKTYTTISTEEMYEEYKQASNQDNYINEFIEKEKANGIVKKEDFFSLLISVAIQKQDISLIEDILKEVDKADYPHLLVNTDEINMSPLTYTLVLDYQDKIKPILKEHLNHGYYFQKIRLTQEALIKLRDTVSYQGESYQDCIDDLIKPICVEDQVDLLGNPHISVETLAL